MNAEEWARIKDRARATRARRCKWMRRWRLVLRLVLGVVLPGCAVLLGVAYPDVAVFVILAPIFAAGVALLVGSVAAVRVVQLAFEAWFWAGAPSVAQRRRRGGVSGTVEPQSDGYLGRRRRLRGTTPLDDYLDRTPPGNVRRRYGPVRCSKGLRDIGNGDGWQWLWSGFPAPGTGGERIKCIFVASLVLWAASVLIGAAYVAFLLFA